MQGDPYQLGDDIVGIGFRTLDKIACQLGFDRQSPKRYRAGLLHVLKELASDGHCFGMRTQLLRDGAKLLGASTEDLDATIDTMIAKGDLISRRLGENEGLYLPLYDMCETQAAWRIQDLLGQGKQRGRPAKLESLLSPTHMAATIDKVQRMGGVVFDAVQLAALTHSTREAFTVITGGPGTGKTVTAVGIIRLFQAAGSEVALAAPTGRAAQRLADATGLEAKTIHRLLEYSSESKGFKRGPANRLDCDVLLVSGGVVADRAGVT